ncbi:MAG: cytochrome c3 family protein [Kofleriaceae bacterium]
MRVRLLIVLALAVVPALAVAGGERGPSAVVFGPQRLPLVFSHAQHVGGLGLACAACHPTAATSRSVVDLLTPTEAACRSCHAIARPPAVTPAPTATATGACAACHPGFAPTAAVARVVIPPASLKFSHAAHASAGCLTCHAGAATAALATAAHLPTMAQCLACHDDRTAARACTTCHLATAGGRVRTALPDGALAPTGGVTGADHGGDFGRDHGAIARSAPAACAACHQERECSDCHQGSLRTMAFHPDGFLALHAVDARRDATACGTCHKTQSFCVACHERAGVAPRAETGFAARPDLRFHPDGWASLDRTGPNRHAGPARANLAECTSCHREDTCLRCHSAEAGTPRISPHGPGWRGSARCQALAARNGRLCLRCHISLTPVGCE